MANPSHNLLSGLFGAAAGLGAMLPTVTCTGACASCFACLGLAGGSAAVLLARLAVRRLGDREPRAAAPSVGRSERGAAVDPTRRLRDS